MLNPTKHYKYYCTTLVPRHTTAGVGTPTFLSGCSSLEAKARAEGSAKAKGSAKHNAKAKALDLAQNLTARQENESAMTWRRYTTTSPPCVHNDTCHVSYLVGVYSITTNQGGVVLSNIM